MTGAEAGAASEPRNLHGMALMTMATVAFAMMHATIRHMSAELDPFEIAFFRNLFGLLVLSPWFLRYGWAPLKTKRLGLHGLRAVLNAVAMLSFFHALALSPLAQVTALGFAAPIFATLLAALILGERVRRRRWVAILVGFAGTMLIVRPGFEALETGTALMIMSSFVWGAALIVIKLLLRTESSVTVATYMVCLMIPLSLVPAIFFWQWPNLEQFGWLALIGVLGTSAQLLMTQALKVAETSVVMPLDFFKLIWATALGYLVFGEIPDSFTWIGGAVIFMSATYIAYRERTLKLRPTVSSTPGAQAP